MSALNAFVCSLVADAGFMGRNRFSWLVWSYKYLLPQRLAVVDDKTITIDHCRPLAWKDIKNAEEKIVRCGFRRLRIIVLHPKKA